jgi:nucleotide-binding universal stress UspA family protein
MGGGFSVGLPPRFDILDSMREEAITELAKIAEGLECDDVTIEIQVGSASELLVQASESADLLVLGSRGHGGFKGLLVGSVGTQVASHAQCPTVVLRDVPRKAANQVIVGIDGSPHSMAAIAFAFDEASRHGWELIAIHAWDVPAYDLIITPQGAVPFPLVDVADSEIRLAAEVLAGFSTDYPDVKVQERLVRAPAVQALLEASTDAALIVVGTRGHGAAVGAVLGSVSNGLLHRATVPVAVVPLIDEEDDVA